LTPRAVTGIGVVSSIGVGWRAFADGLATGARPSARPSSFDPTPYGASQVAEVAHFDAAKYLGDKGLRTLDRLSKLLVVAVRLGLEDCGLKVGGTWTPADRPWPERIGLVVSNAYGSLEAIHELDRVAILEDARYINPSRFPLTVSNSAAGYASIWEDLRALNVSVSDGHCGALDAVSCADLFLEEARADVILVGGAEAMSEALFVAFRKMGASPKDEIGASPKDEIGASPKDEGNKRSTPKDGGLLGEGAALVALESAKGARARGANILAEITGYGTAFTAPRGESALMVATPQSLEDAMSEALADARIGAHDVDVVVSGVHGSGAFDDAELEAIRRTFGSNTCVTAPKRAIGETLGASGALAMAAAIALLERGVPTHVVRGALRGPARTALVTMTGYYGNASALVIRTVSG
jgi:3-oxoacyl-(acyl-carrier-protein) synthase